MWAPGWTMSVHDQGVLDAGSSTRGSGPNPSRYRAPDAGAGGEVAGPEGQRTAVGDAEGLVGRGGRAPIQLGLVAFTVPWS